MVSQAPDAHSPRLQWSKIPLSTLRDAAKRAATVEEFEFLLREEPAPCNHAPTPA